MKKLLTISALTMTALTIMGQKPNYPLPPKDNTIDEYFGVKVADPFRPLENDTSATTAAWVEAENRVTQDYLAKIPQRDKYLKRLKQVVNYQKVYTPFEKNGNGIFTRTTDCKTKPCSTKWKRLTEKLMFFLTQTNSASTAQ